MRFIAGLIMVMLFMQGQVFAGEKTSLDKWLKELRTTIEKIVPKKSGPQSTTAVSGVRGADTNAGDPLYWKGKKEDITEKELAEFNEALTSAEQGKKEEAVRKFEDFLKHYPSSELAGDARDALGRLKSS